VSAASVVDLEMAKKKEKVWSVEKWLRKMEENPVLM
jgi:hypothetical protein